VVVDAVAAGDAMTDAPATVKARIALERTRFVVAIGKNFTKVIHAVQLLTTSQGLILLAFSKNDPEFSPV